MQKLKEVFELIKENNILLNIEKCSFFLSEIKYLGNIRKGDMVQTDLSLLEKIKVNFKPTSQRDVRKVVGLMNWFRPFVPHLSAYTGFLTDKLKENQIKWGQPD